MGRADQEVLDFLQANGGVIKRAEALALGMPRSTIQEWVARGHLVVAGYGIYVQPGVLDSERTLIRAATRSLDAVASHESAARLHGLDDFGRRTATVSVPIRRSNRFVGVSVHQLTDLTADEVVDIVGLPVTDPTRTTIDLASVLPAKTLGAALDQAVRMRLTSYEAVSRRLEGLARKGKPGVSKLRSVLRTRMTGSRVTDSSLEDRLLEVLAQGGLPTPETQFRPEFLRSMSGRVDVAYVAEMVIVEADGIRWHGSPEAFQADRQRDNLAQLAGWVILRFTWHDVTERSHYVVNAVATALSERRRAGISAPVH